jgi:TRAP-type uncharacterized transport system substrate-binding protein
MLETLDVHIGSISIEAYLILACIWTARYDDVRVSQLPMLRRCSALQAMTRRFGGRLAGYPFGKLALITAPSVIAALIVFTVFRLADPFPSRTLVISTASPSSGYEGYARRYGEILEKSGVSLEIRTSGGSAENLERLRDKASRIQAAFSTVGAAHPGDEARIASLGGMFLTPVFIFYRSDETITRFSQFRGKRLSIEPLGTTLREFLLQILRASDAVDATTTLTELSGGDAIDALIAGGLDAAMFSSANPESPAVRRALTSAALRLMSVSEADAISVMVPALRHVVMPRAMLSLADDRPPAAIDMLALGNALLVRKDVHPALQLLLLETARQVHRAPGPFQRFGEFPAPQPQDLPLSETAERFYRAGPPFLQQYTSFWVAAFIDRIAIVLIPLIAVLIPAIGYALPFYRWLNGRHIWRWHHALGALEREFALETDGDRQSELRTRIAEIEQAVDKIKVARPMEGELYHLRGRVRALRERVR